MYPRHLAIQLLGPYTKEPSAFVYQDICSKMFIKAVNWKQPKWPPKVECMNKL